MIDYREDDATGIVELTVRGRIDRAAFETVSRSLESFIARHPSGIGILEVVESFEGMAPSLLRDDIRFSLAHMRDFSHAAVVTDKGWMRTLTSLAGHFVKAEVRLFGLDEIEAARTWLREAKSGAGDGSR